MKQYLRSCTHFILCAITLSVVVACAGLGKDIVDHAFGFDMAYDDQDAVVLDYRYGESKNPVHAQEWAVREGKEISFDGVNGPMSRGDFLYVKWKNKLTGKVYEETVDLRQWLPRDIERHRVHFMIWGAQLYVYLVSPEKRPPDMPEIGPRKYSHRKVFQIYPDQITK